MNHKIIQHKKNVALGREEFILKVEADKNPTKKEVLDLLKKDDVLSVVKKIKGSFGKGDFDVEIVTYESKKHRDDVEVIGRKIKKKMAEEAKKAAEAAKQAPATQ